MADKRAFNESRVSSLYEIKEAREEKPTISESKAVILAVFCSFLICVVLFFVLWFGRDIEHCNNSFSVKVQGAVSFVNKPYYPITFRGSNYPARMAIQTIGHVLNITYAICRTTDDGTPLCFNRTQSGAVVEDTWVDLYEVDPCREDNSTQLWIQVYSISPNPAVLMYCFATDDIYAPTCLQTATASPIPQKLVTPAIEADSPVAHHKKRDVDVVTEIMDTPKKRRDISLNQNSEASKFLSVQFTYSANPDWNLFSTSYAWDPLDGFIPQFLPPNSVFKYCAQSFNFRKLDLSYRACYADTSSIPGRTLRKCTTWVDTLGQWFINDTLPFSPTATEGSVTIQFQAAEGEFVAAVGLVPDIEQICGTDGSILLVSPPSSSPAVAPAPSSTPTTPPTTPPTPTPPPPSGH